MKKKISKHILNLDDNSIHNDKLTCKIKASKSSIGYAKFNPKKISSNEFINLNLTQVEEYENGKIYYATWNCVEQLVLDRNEILHHGGFVIYFDYTFYFIENDIIKELSIEKAIKMGAEPIIYELDVLE